METTCELNEAKAMLLILMYFLFAFFFFFLITWSLESLNLHMRSTVVAHIIAKVDRNVSICERNQLQIERASCEMELRGEVQHPGSTSTPMTDTASCECRILSTIVNIWGHLFS